MRKINEQVLSAVASVTVDGRLTGTAFAICHDQDSTVFVTNRECLEGADLGRAAVDRKAVSEIASSNGSRVAILRVSDRRPLLPLALSASGSEVQLAGSCRDRSGQAQLRVIDGVLGDQISVPGETWPRYEIKVENSDAIRSEFSGAPVCQEDNGVVGIVAGPSDRNRVTAFRILCLDEIDPQLIVRNHLQSGVASKRPVSRSPYEINRADAWATFTASFEQRHRVLAFVFRADLWDCAEAFVERSMRWLQVEGLPLTLRCPLCKGAAAANSWRQELAELLQLPSGSIAEGRPLSGWSPPIDLRILCVHIIVDGGDSKPRSVAELIADCTDFWREASQDIPKVRLALFFSFSCVKGTDGKLKSVADNVVRELSALRGKGATPPCVSLGDFGPVNRRELVPWLHRQVSDPEPVIQNIYGPDAEMSMARLLHKVSKTNIA